MKTEVLSPQPIPKMDVYLRNLTMTVPASAKGIYTCPMHPEVQQDHPGNCPKCGMTLEPKTAKAGTGDEESADLRDMTQLLGSGPPLHCGVYSGDSSPDPCTGQATMGK